MNQAYLYLEINIICLIILGYLFSKYRNAEIMEYNRILFRRFLLCGVLLCASDVIWVLIDGTNITGAKEINWITNTIYYAMTSVSSFCWFMFAENELNSGLCRSRRSIFWCSLPLLVAVFIDLVSWHTGWIFYINAANCWSRGPYYFVHVLINCGYVIFTTSRTLAKAMATELYVTKRRLFTLTFFAVPFLTGTVLSQILVGYTLAEVGQVLSALLVYLNLQEQQVSQDFLTRLNNRNELHRILQGKLQFFNYPKKLYLLVIDLDYFKKINDEYGHIEGDKALIRVAEVLRKVGDVYDCFIARFGGDEFVLLCEAEDEKLIKDLCEDIHVALHKSNEQNKVPYKLELSIGYAVQEKSMAQVEEFIARADAQMYAAKNKSRQ